MEISPAYKGEHPVIEALSSLPTQLDSFEEWADFLIGLHWVDPPPYLPKPHHKTCKYDSRFMLHSFPPIFRFIDDIEISAELNRETSVLHNIFYGYQRDEMVVIKTPNVSFHSNSSSELSERMKRERDALTQGDAPFWIKPRGLIYATSLSAQTAKDNIINIKPSPHLVLPFVHPGLELGQFCNAKEFQQTARTDEFIAAACIQLCMACDYFHERDIIVRDLKPHDIMVTAPSRDKGFIVCLDGGLFLTRGLSRLTAPGIVWGAIQYMAPETLSDGIFDECTDVYSLGCVLYFMAAGHVPFYGETQYEIFMKKKRDENPNIELLDGLQPELKELILRMLAKNPDERPQSMKEVASVLQWLIADSAVRDYLGPARNFGVLSIPDVFDPKAHAALAEVLEK